ncbi:MAG: flagellar hook protein FlgE [Thermotaleaceae bacterium]
MMRSMYSAVSSLRAHQLKMDVIGNNIANVNTVGYKGSRVTFQEVFSQTLRGAGRPQENGRGGTNPQQVGLGISISSMDTFHMRGAVESTGYNTDLMINGDGFFIVSDTSDGSKKSYTRAGNFGLDTDGNLITPDGFYVLGYEYNEDGVLIEDLKGLKISKSITSPPKASDTAIFEGNINSNLAPAGVQADFDALKQLVKDDEDKDVKSTYSTTMKFYDSLGNSHNVTMTFVHTGVDGDGNREFNAYIRQIDGVDATGITPDLTKLSFDSAGKLVKIDDTGDLAATPPVPFPNIFLGVPGNILNGADALNIQLDFTKLKSYSSPSDAAALKVNGYESGKLDDFTISSTGEIEGVFSNGETRILGQIRLANFKNPAGLLKTGSNMYRETANSGEAMFGYPAAGGFANLQPGALEMSNVDLSREFTDMITTQRGFQANSRIITTSDEMLQEVVNMKR